ncbi:flavodoxin domain-containing protein [Halobium salinum]|uniref:Flavodoxin domain-containing protein n=1 Tax=Halobium salinum TaxID=1364940 RepID=A0ABD5PGS9_9EURY|nr:flavodoxin domain-containing protein [Halobium salinum]
MPSILVAYATTEGQTEKVARRVETTLRERGHDVTLVTLGGGTPPDPADFDGVVVAGSIHAGRHQPVVETFVRDHVDALNARPTGFLSVSLSAAEEATQAEAEGYVDAFLEETGWKPRVTLPVAGALRYTEYGFLKRTLVKHVVGKRSGDTDTSRNYEYTDWGAVEAFAADLAAAIEPAPTTR